MIKPFLYFGISLIFLFVFDVVTENINESCQKVKIHHKNIFIHHYSNSFLLSPDFKYRRLDFFFFFFLLNALSLRKLKLRWIAANSEHKRNDQHYKRSLTKKRPSQVDRARNRISYLRLKGNDNIEAV